MNREAPDWLDEVLTDTAQDICSEWCGGEHYGTEAVNEHLWRIKAAISQYIAEQVETERLAAQLDLIMGLHQSALNDETFGIEDLEIMGNRLQAEYRAEHKEPKQ